MLLITLPGCGLAVDVYRRGNTCCHSGNPGAFLSR
jgi:hypothetical protein